MGYSNWGATKLCRSAAVWLVETGGTDEDSNGVRITWACSVDGRCDSELRLSDRRGSGKSGKAQVT